LVESAEVELAIWFHDAVYDPRRGDNEEQSARLAEEQLIAAEVDPVSATHVANLIRLTNHEHDQLEGDAAVLCDVDLAILGAEPRRFERYDAAIRQEYEWVPESVYRIERGRVLARFLDRPHIYHTPFFHDMLEERARENLTRAIKAYMP
jgi:predicted metal-dependent HD superfamily phosphohydrolase